MITRIFCALALATAPAAVMAESLSDTHEQVSSPGKATIAYRPLAARQPVAAKCHPEASKAIACEAQASIARSQALALKRAAKAERLSSN